MNDSRPICSQGCHTPSYKIVVIDNTIKTTRIQDSSKYLGLLLRFLRSGRMAGIISVNVVRTVGALKDSLNEGANRIIMSGSSIFLRDVKENSRHQKLAELAIEKSDEVPVLGICFGAQMINGYFGGTLEEMEDILCMPTKVKWIKNESTKSYQFCLKFLPKTLGKDLIGRAILEREEENGAKIKETKKTRTSINDSFVAFSHKTKMLHGVVFHPEAIMDDTIRKKAGSDVLTHFIKYGTLLG